MAKDQSTQKPINLRQSLTDPKVLVVLIPAMVTLILGVCGLLMPLMTRSTPVPDPTSTTVAVTPTLTEDETRKVLTELVHRESRAVVGIDRDEIGRIFSPDVEIIDRRTNTKWHDAGEYYASVFSSKRFCAASHGDILITLLDASTAKASSSSSGRWRKLDSTTNECFDHFENPPGSDQWHFKKSANGAWQIDSFSFS